MSRNYSELVVQGPVMGKAPREPYPELPSVLHELITGVSSCLGRSFVGAYLVGSLATGDFDLDSDVDFLMVTQGELADEAIPVLQALHTRIHGLGSYPAQHLEGSYVSKRILNQADSVEGDFADALYGPLAYYNSRFGQAFAILNGCRMLQTLHTGTVQSKFSGANWAIHELGRAWTGLVQRAWEERKGVRFGLKIRQCAEPHVLRETLDFLRYLVTEGERCVCDREL